MNDLIILGIFALFAVISMLLAYRNSNIVTKNLFEAQRQLFMESVRAVKASSLSEYEGLEDETPLPLPQNDEFQDAADMDPGILLKHLEKPE